MQITEIKRANYATVIGEIITIDLTDGVANKTGVPYVRATIEVRAGESDFKVEAFQSQKWGVGTDKERENPNYKALKELSVGSRKSLACSINENRFAAKDGNIVSTQRIDLNFINEPKNSDVDGMTFEFTGFVSKPLSEKVDSEGNITHYEIKFTQGQYQASRGGSTVTFAVDARDTAKITAIQSAYSLGTSGKIVGTGKATIVETKKVEEAIFGDPIVHITQNYTCRFYITGGAGITELQTYTPEEIDFLRVATEENDALLLANAKNKAKETPSSTEPKKTATDFLGI